MKLRHRARRAGVVAAATALLSGVAVGGGPAHAASVGAGAVVATTAIGLHNVDAVLSYDATPVPGGALVVWNCKAVAWFDPASTGLGTCRVAGTEAVGSPGNAPGAVYAAAGAVFVRDGTTPQACVEGHASFVVGGVYLSTGTRCGNLLLLHVSENGIIEIGP